MGPDGGLKVSGSFWIKGKPHKAFKRTLSKSGKTFMWSVTPTKTGIKSTSIINRKTGLAQHFFVIDASKVKTGEFIADNPILQAIDTEYQNHDFGGEFDAIFDG